MADREEDMQKSGVSGGETEDLSVSSAEDTEQEPVTEVKAAESKPEAVVIPDYGWAGIGLLAGLLIAGVAAAAASFIRTRKSRRCASHGVRVEKLHGQGARKNQQDCFFVSPNEETAGLLAVVADGMGGLKNGDKVSETAVTAMAEAFFVTKGLPHQVLLALTLRARRAVNDLLGDAGLRTGGCTLAAGLLRDGEFTFLSIGDSRTCLYRDGVLYQLNREHIFKNELYLEFLNGERTLESAENHPKGSGLTSFLGMGELQYVDMPARSIRVRPGDKLIIMSDGVYNALSEQELCKLIGSPAGETAAALEAAIEAKHFTNQDNYTAVILNC